VFVVDGFSKLSHQASARFGMPGAQMHLGHCFGLATFASAFPGSGWLWSSMLQRNDRQAREHLPSQVKHNAIVTYWEVTYV
jgi:hypothetical protein